MRKGWQPGRSSEKTILQWMHGMEELELNENTFFDVMEKSEEKGKFLQTFTNSLDQRVDLIIKPDKPFLSFNCTSLQLYCKLAEMGLDTGRPDLQKKGMLLLKKYLFVDIDKFLLQYENDQKMMKI